MKKLLVVLLTVVMILSLAAIASAEVSTWIGGDFYFRYHSVDKAWEQGRNNFFVGGITALAKKDNTWAKLWINTDIWTSLTGLPWDSTAPGWGSSMKYAVGVDKIGGIASVSFSTKDQDLCNIGQAPLADTFDDFKTDPVFNTYDCSNEMAVVVDTDAFTFKAESVVAAVTDPTKSGNTYAVNGIFKFEGGKAYLAYKGNIGGVDSTLIDAGCELKLGEMNLKADAWLTAAGGSSTGNTVQGSVAMGAWDATLSVYLPPSGGGDSIIGVGGNYKLDKLTLGAKYFTYTDAVYEIYGTYNVGAFDLRVGYVEPGAGIADCPDRKSVV